MLKINELRISTSGASDNTSNFIELIGPPNQSLDGRTLVVISGEFAPGNIDFAFDLTGGTTDADGVFLLSNPGEYANDAGDLTASFDLFGSPTTILLVEGFTGAVGDDLDTNDDGAFDTMPWTSVVDSVSLIDGDGTADINFSTTVVGPDGNFTPAGAARVPDETGAFAELAFSDLSADTPGTLNAPVGVSDFTLELLHFTDQEAASAAVQDAPNLSAVLNALRAEDLGADGLADNTLVLSSGDAFLPGIFFESGAAAFGSVGIADIQIQNELGVQAMALGNHEFDLGTDVLADLINGDAAGGFFGADFTGTEFPYLSANLDFSTDANLAPLAVANGQAPQGGTVSGSTVIDVNGELIGVVGATTPTLARISSPGNVGIAPIWADTDPTDAELDALAAEIQAEVDALLAANPSMNKVVLLAHMQQLPIELGLAERLENVDIIVAGGSNTRLFDDNDRIRSGDTDQGDYPQFVTNAGGTTTAVVNTDGSYKYVGRLVIDFDANGDILPASYDADISGAYATDDQGVADLNAQALIDPEIQAIADAIEAQIIASESEVFGYSNVFLNGNRGSLTDGEGLDGVRTQETNLGNLTADANLAAAQAVDPTVVLSLKNGGGIRASIGETVVLPGDNEATRLPNGEIVDGDGNVIKPENAISQNDIQTTLAFNNGLTLLTVTGAELVALLEHGVSALPDANGRFPQVSGVEFSFDLDQPSGARLVDVTIVDADGTVIANVMENGVIADPTAEYRMVTLGFLAEPRFDADGNYIGGGDGYPFPNANTDPTAGETVDATTAARIAPTSLVQDGVQTGDATFADDGTEQDALAEYLDDNFGTPADAFDEADGIAAGDARIVNLDATDPDAEPNFMDAKADEDDLRVATYNASLNRNGEGDLIADLTTTDDAQAQAVAEIIQRTDPDVILINEFDYDPDGTAANLFRTNYLEVSQNGQDPVEYPYVYVAASNTGVGTGFDLNNDGVVGTEGFALANDAHGFGTFEGQYGFVIYSKYPIDEDNIRTFQEFLWKDMPDANLPADPLDTDGNSDLTSYYTDEELEVLRLSSKNHVDVPIIVNGETVHILAAHPTPPVFDGVEDRNGLRNADEIRFWADYVEPANSGYIYDDEGETGGLPAGERFVILGDYNADPFDGDSANDAALQLLDNPRIAGSATDPDVTPDSTGGPEASLLQAGDNDTHLGNPAFDTADFGFAGGGNPDNAPGNLRVDYVLPSQAGFDIVDAQVFWPDEAEFPEQAALAGFPTSDHRLVAMDLSLTEAPLGTGEIKLERLTAFDSGAGEGGSEVVVFDADSARMLTTNGEDDQIDVVDLSDPANPVLLFSVDLSASVNFYDGIQSVAVKNGIAAAAVSRTYEDPDGNEQSLEGAVVIFDVATGDIIDTFSVGFLPDMVTFTPDGSKILVANEGEPDDFGEVPGGVSIIDLTTETVTTAGFDQFDDMRNELAENGVRLFPTDAGVTGNGDPAMMAGENGYKATPIFTVGETITGTTGALNATTAGDYTPVGVLDGLGAYKMDDDTVRVFASHELLAFRGSSYEVSDGAGGSFTIDSGARISYFDIDVETKEITDAGLAFDTIYDANGNVATDTSFLTDGFDGFSRFCSSVLIEPDQFGEGMGLENTIFFAGEEDGGRFNPIGGAEWALDPATGDLWQVSAMGRGAWENVAAVDTGTTTHVAFILSDDTSPFDFDGDGVDEVAPLFLYVGEKDPSGDFLEQNGLRDGQMYVWVADDGSTTPLDFNGTSPDQSLGGTWVPIDNSQQPGLASADGSTGYDEYGFPTQGTLWAQAAAVGAFGFSRPEDVATNPHNGAEFVLASTGVDTFAVDPVTGDGADSFGTIYTMEIEFGQDGAPLGSPLTIVYDGDADPTRALRSPDNLDWADDGFIYVQEDQAEFDTLTGEPLFNEGAVNTNEASILRLNPADGSVDRVAQMDRSVVLDPSSTGTPVDVDAGFAGAWESSGILDVSTLFDEDPGTLFLFDAQAHGIEDQTDINPDSRINDGDLVEGGQLLFLENTVAKPSVDFEPEYIAVNADGTKAFVSLQEANAVAVLDIATGTFTEIQPLGTIDHSLPGNELDASDRDDAIAIQNWQVNGMHMPDAIASYEVGGVTYYVTANEGDARDADDRVKDLDLDPDAFPNADLLQEDELLGRLNVSTIDGDIDGDGDFDALYAYGTRSFTIFDEFGNKVFDSGSDFEQIIADLRVPNAFNNQDFPTGADDEIDEDRSDNKGPEPEAVTIGMIGDQFYAFVGLERDNGIMVYNVTDPANSEFVQYINSSEAGDISPETLAFVPAEDSPNGKPLLLAANEVSGTTTIYQVDIDPIPTALPGGVASGDVTQDSVVLMTRSVNLGDVTFTIYDDTGTEVQSLTATVTDETIPVKVEVMGLTPGMAYTYSVTDASGAEMAGEFTTAHAEGYNGLTFGITGDWRGELAPFSAVSNIPDAELDFLLLGGDTIYADYPTDAVPGHAVTLEEYRAKFAEVYGETLGENFFGDVFRSTSVYVTIDDHEVTNDFAGGGLIGTTGEAEFADFFPGDDPNAFVNDATLYENGLQAFHDYHPISEQFYGETGDDLTAGERQLYRSQEFGQDAAVFMLDQRSFRDEQIESVDLTDPTDFARFIAETNDPTRTMLGDAQMADLKADLLAAEANGVTWKFIYTPEPFQNLGLGNGDSWEGYEAERRELLQFIEDNDIDNVVFVAADIHATFVNNITYSEVPGGPQIGTSTFEITTGSVAFDPAFGPAVVDAAAAIGLLDASEVAYYNSLPIAPDNELPGGFPNDKDDIVREAFNALTLAPLGLDPLGLDDNLAQADGMIDATLVQGGWVSAHTYGWTEFDIDAETQQLTVTTYGIEGYSAADIAANPDLVVDAEPMIVSQFTVDAQPNAVKVYDIQGADHRSPMEGLAVATTGIVTAIDPGEGFWVQDPDGDGDAATSDGIFVNYGMTDAVTKGDMVEVLGTVAERQFGDDLSTTILDDVSSVEIMSSGNTLPDAVLIGDGGLLPPTTHIDDDGLTEFQPTEDGIDFFEALEGMRVTLQDGAHVLGSNRFGETFVSVNSGQDGRTDAGGVLLDGENGVITDANPERIIIDDDIYADSGRGTERDDVPAATAGDTVSDVTGVFDYSFGEFKLLAEEAPIVTPGTTEPETSTLPAGDQSGDLTVGTYNVLNLDPSDPQEKFDQLAEDIVAGMGAPAIIGLQEIQDNNGSTDDGTVVADVTYQMLIDAIIAAGGPTYAFADSTPDDKTDGGQPGANIRVGFLYDTSKVSLTDTLRIEGALDPEGAFDEDPIIGDGVNEGYEGTRKPLVGTFLVDGEEVTVVVTHFKSKSGDTPLSGAVQPPVEVTSAQRIAQAQAVNAFVSDMLDTDPNAKIVVLGDMNDFEFSTPLMELAGDDLTNLSDLLPEGDAYSFNFNGNSQLLDHILVSDALLDTAQVDVVHLNSDFPSDEVASDHDPIVAYFDLDNPDNAVFGSDDPDQLLGSNGNNDFFPGLGADTLRLFFGNDKIIGNPGDFDEDIVLGFGTGDVFELLGVRLSDGDVTFDRDAGVVDIDGEQVSLPDADLDGGSFLLFREGGNSFIQFVMNRIALSDGEAVDPEDVNGIDPEEFLTGQNGQAFEVELDIAGAGYSNALGYFTRNTTTGAIETVEILFENAKAAGSGAVAIIEDIEADQELAFFLVQKGANVLDDLTGDIGLAEVNGQLFLTEDGTVLDDTFIFNSLDADLNADGIEHVLSGVTEDGLGLRVGFEDLLNGGDNDYQDVTFTVTVLDDTLL